MAKSKGKINILFANAGVVEPVPTQAVTPEHFDRTFGIMTSFAFTFGVIPLMISHGAGAEMRVSIGTAVFFGMLGVTFFGVVLTPVFYVVIRRVPERKKAVVKGALPHAAASAAR